MSTTQITGRIFGEGPPISLQIEDGRIVKMQNAFDKVSDSDFPSIAPGFCDLQVNGFNGVDFNQSASLTTEEFSQATRGLWSEGCTSFLPTLITNSNLAVEARLREIDSIIDNDPQLAASMLGFHLEGPHISLDDGYRGAHDQQFVCAPDIDAYNNFQSVTQRRVLVLTLSPEWEGSQSFIAAAVAAGTKVSIGHTNATPSQIYEAVENGASLVTHFGNGVAGLISRHPNVMWEQLANDGLACSVIADGFHLPDSVLKTVFRVKDQQAFLVSDSTSLAGLPAGDYQTHIGGDVTLCENGKLHLKGQPNLLAGSAQSLRHCVEHLTNHGILTLADAWQRASTIPAEIIGGREHASIEVGAFANVVQYRYDGTSLDVQRTWLRGMEVYKTT